MNANKFSPNKFQPRAGAPWLWLAGVMVLAPSPFFGGCAIKLINTPKEEVAPPTPAPIYLDPNKMRNSAELMVGDQVKPDHATTPAYYVSNPDTQVEAGDIFSLQPIILDAAGGEHYMVDTKEPKNFKKYQIRVKLAGIYCPQAGEPGWREAAEAARGLLAGKKFEVVQDPKFPVTADGRKIVVLKFKVGDQIYCFNQSLVRRGFAWVDLTALTSFDNKEWAVDEEYARGLRLEHTKMDLSDPKNPVPAKNAKNEPIIVKQFKAVGVGLWSKKLGVKPTKRGGADLGPMPTWVPIPAGGAGGATGATDAGSSTGMPSSTGAPPSSSPTGSPTGSPMGSGSGSMGSPTSPPPSASPTTQPT